MTNFYQAKSCNEQSRLIKQPRRRAPAQIPSTGQFTLTKNLAEANPFQAGSHIRQPCRELAGILRHQSGHQRLITPSRARKFGNKDYFQRVPDYRSRDLNTLYCVCWVITLLLLLRVIVIKVALGFKNITLLNDNTKNMS